MIDLKNLEIGDELTQDGTKLIVSGIGVKHYICVKNEQGREITYIGDQLHALKYLNEEKEMIGLWKNSKWDEYARQFLMHRGNNLLNSAPKGSAPQDIKNYCKRYYNLSKEGRINFWIYFLSCMAKKESNFDPNCVYKENFKDAKGHYVMSRGLFQMSIESLKGYGFKHCDGHIHDPKISIEWAIVILSKWVKKDHCIGLYKRKWYGRKIYKGGGRYWSVLRCTSAHKWIKKSCINW